MAAEEAVFHRIETILDRHDTRTVHAASPIAIGAIGGVLAAQGVRVDWLDAERTLDTAIGLRIEAALGSLALSLSADRALAVEFVLDDRAVPRRAVLRSVDGQEAAPDSRVLARCVLSLGVPELTLPVPNVRFWINDPALDEDSVSPYRGIARRALSTLSPVWLDTLRQRRTDRLNARLLRHLARRHAGNQAPTTIGQKPLGHDRRPGGPTLMIGLRWLDYGGAEAFAIATMEAAARAGYEVVVVCDTMGRHQLLPKARRWAKIIYLLDELAELCGSSEMLWRALHWHRPDVLHIQHSALAYEALPRIRADGMATRVIDTNHLLEHRTGGYVVPALRQSRHIDLHHVISDDLRRFFVEQGRVPAGRVRLGKLYDLSRHLVARPGKWDRVLPLRVAFVGRFMQQKRPFLFIEIAARLTRRHGREAFQFTALGSGELRPLCEGLALKKGLDEAVLRFLPGSADVAEILADAHLLLVPSDNEGLALVAFEAIRADCLVISCDVGGQGEIVLPELLVPRNPRLCIARMIATVERVRSGALPAASLLEAQRAMLRETKRGPTGLDACDYTGGVR